MKKKMKKKEKKLNLEREREREREKRDRKALEKIEGIHIKFNLNQPSFINVARISDMFHQKLNTCT